MTKYLRYLPTALVVLTLAYFASKTRPQPIEHPMNLNAFAALMVSYDGRLQPLDSVARNTMLVMARRTQWTPDVLLWTQLKDIEGLAGALVEQGKAGGTTPGSHIWSLFTEAERATVTEVAGGEANDTAMLKTLTALNRVIDDVGRAVEVHRSTPETLGKQTKIKPFYLPESFAGVTLTAEERDQHAKFNEWMAQGAPVGHVNFRLPSRPLTIAFNRKLLGRAFPDFIDAETVARQPAMLWLADAVTDPVKASVHRIFRIDHPRLRQLLGLEMREGFTYSLDEIVELDHYLGLIGQELSEDEIYQGNLGKLQHERRLAKENGDKGDPFVDQVGTLWRDVSTYLNFSRMNEPYWVPPTAGAAAGALEASWRRFFDTVIPGGGLQLDSEHATRLLKMVRAYGESDVAVFNNLVAEHRAAVDQQLPSDARRARFETFYNRFDVFYLCTAMYLIAFLVVLSSWMFWSAPHIAEPLRQAAFWMIVAVLCVHGLGLIARMYLMERPWVFVTNLYSTAIFIGWIALVASLFIERYTRLGIGLAAATIIGVCTGIVAINLRIDKGDTLELQQAVLDTNFWLATHVTAINIGYSATYLAGALGILYIFAGVFTRALSHVHKKSGEIPKRVVIGGMMSSATAIASLAGSAVVKGDTVGKTLTKIIYGTVCFATLFSFVGTVLGGIWADQSWGRFWGWDPKENGALMIVIWNAIILHARWGGMVQARGIATLAVFGNIITTWSYFGTNQLGVGLHAYGFMDSAVFWILFFCATQLVVIGLGVLPLKWWRSFSEPKDGGRGPGILPGAITAASLIALFTLMFVVMNG